LIRGNIEKKAGKNTGNIPSLRWVDLCMVTLIICRNSLPDSGIRAIKSLWVRIESWKNVDKCRSYYDHRAEYSSPIEINGTLNRKVSHLNIAQPRRERERDLTVPLMKFFPCPGSLYVNGTAILAERNASSKSAKYSA